MYNEQSCEQEATIKSYLDRICSAVASLNGIFTDIDNDEETGIELCDNRRNSIHIYTGIYRAAKAVGAEINVTESKSERVFPIEISFEYKGIIFFEAESREEYERLSREQALQ